MGYLTTVYLVNEFSEINDNDLIEQIIPYAHKAIEEYVDHSLESATYKKWVDGTGSNEILLKEWPVTRLIGCSTQAQDAINIKYTGGGKFATVETTESAVKLFSVDASGNETDTSLTFADNATVSDMATAIAAVDGWTATVLADLGDYPSNIIRSNINGHAVSPDDVDLEVPDEAVDVYLVQDSDRTVQRQHGFVFPAGRNNIFLWYTAGYTMPVDRSAHDGLSTVGNVPGDLALVANLMVKAIYDACMEDLGPASSIKSGDWSRSFNEGARGIADLVLKENSQVLARYRNYV